MGYEWFPSFDAIPGVRWESLVPVDRSRLKGLEARPRVEEKRFYDGRPYQQVDWLTATGAGLSEESGSPAVLHRRKFEDAKALVPHAVVIAISEMLALPGTRSDYHFGMLWAWGALYNARHLDTRAFGWIERLCLADICLMEQGPHLVFAEDHWSDLDEQGGYPIFPAFQQLSSLYQHEGFLVAAVEIEKRWAALDGGRPTEKGAVSRQSALLEEDGR